MSERQQGPWRRKSNGNIVLPWSESRHGYPESASVDETPRWHQELPDDCELLVPESRMDDIRRSVTAEAERADGLLAIIRDTARELSIPEGGWFYADLPQMAKQLRHNADTFEHNWMMQTSHFPAVESAADLTPEILRWIAKVMLTIPSYLWFPAALERDADLLEADQDKKAEREQLVADLEDAVASTPGWLTGDISRNDVVAALLADARFVITRTEAEG